MVDVAVRGSKKNSKVHLKAASANHFGEILAESDPGFESGLIRSVCLPD